MNNISESQIQEALRANRGEVLRLTAPLRAVQLRVLMAEASIRRDDLYDVEFVAEVSAGVDLSTILRVAHELEQVLRCRVHIHDLLVDCEDNRIARKESVPL